MLIWIIFVLLAVFLGLGYYVIHLAVTGRRYTQESLAAQLDKPAYREIRETSLASTGWVASHAHEELHVMSYDGKLLHATYLPKAHAKGTILLFHGYRSCWQIDFGLVLPYYYDTLGYSLLLVDQRAHGQSQGKYLTFGVRERMDVISWATYMGQKLPRLPVGLLLPICGLFTKLYAGFGLHDASTIDAVRESRYPILFIHGTGDTFVPCEMTKEAYAACTSEKELILVDSAEHGKSYLVEKGRVEEALCRFLAAYTE